MKSQFVQRALALILTFTITTAPVLAASSQRRPSNNSKTKSEALNLAITAANERTQVEALKLLVYASVLSSKIGGVVEVPVEVQKKYNNFRNAVFASLPMSVLTGGVGFS